MLHKYKQIIKTLLKDTKKNLIRLPGKPCDKLAIYISPQQNHYLTGKYYKTQMFKTSGN